MARKNLTIKTRLIQTAEKLVQIMQSSDYLDYYYLGRKLIFSQSQARGLPTGEVLKESELYVSVNNNEDFRHWRDDRTFASPRSQQTLKSQTARGATCPWQRLGRLR